MINFVRLSSMKKIISFITDNHSWIYKVLLFVSTITFIVYLFPKQGKFKYDFYSLKNKPWSYEDLVSPFDFAIKKTRDEINKEREEILKNHKPYFHYEENVYQLNSKVFIEEFIEKYGDKDKSAFNHHNYITGKSVLDNIYKKGIVQTVDAIENKPSEYSILVVYNNVAEEKELGSFYTVQSADEYIQAQLKADHNVNYDLLVPIIQNAIAQDILYDQETSEKILKQALDEISLTRNVVMKDQIIISKGEIVDAEKYQELASLKDRFEEQLGGSSSYIFISFGHVVIVSICMMMLVFFIAIFRKDIFADNTKVLFILLLIVLMVLMASLTMKFDKLSIYVLPFCILPIIIRAFYDTRLALFVHLVTVLIISFFAPNRFEFLFIQLAAGIVAIFSIVNMRNRSQIFISSGIILLTYSFSYFGLMIIQEGRADTINWFDYFWFAINAGLVLFAYPLIFVFEKLFGFLSDVSLMELSDTNSPLLRELASKAPGTFQHSLQVANLVEEAMYKIGGNVLLARAGALYHDVGKMDIPMYFIENQTTGVNPHEEMGYEESASVIISHVIKGIEKAKKYNVPEQVIDFIRTHHGTTKTGYFFNSYKKNFPDSQIDENIFQYPGPIPYSKETSVLMMADAVEAASKSLKIYDSEEIDQLVENIIDSQTQQNQFVNSDITFRDVNAIKKTFKKKLMSIYHVRVEYPG